MVNANEFKDFIKWIPYEEFENIEKISQGGFGNIYNAGWIQGSLYMISNKFERTGSTHVALKSGVSSQHLEENGISLIHRCYSFTKLSVSKYTEEYMLVIQLAEDSDLLKYLTKNFNQIRWLENKLPILANIANSLKIIHKESLTHRDLHWEIF
ncbi:4775_t:CDS:2 [Dentiscutata heterogama]|uniref:4775_t:CDS:1 n=1 Tax=Dentiscutata heterogama TaxID=1316150 RepID=A0ACA9LGL1_9GLOM|nr:4775_t:CDS:2 [Dentiscutata heterogama]